MNGSCGRETSTKKARAKPHPARNFPKQCQHLGPSTRLQNHGLPRGSVGSLVRLLVSRGAPAGMTVCRKFTHKSVTRSLADICVRLAEASSRRLTEGGILKDETFFI